jgi:hypothetical protein
MDLLTKLGLTKELDSLANLVIGGTLPLMERIEKVRRIDEIVKLLTAEPAPVKKESLLEVVLKKHGLAVRLKPKYDFEYLLRQYFVDEDNSKLKSEMLHVLNIKTTQFGGAYLREKLAQVFNEGVFIEQHNGGLFLDYVKKSDSPVWSFISWLYDHDHFITGPKAIAHQVDAGDMFGAGEEDNTTADEDFEAEAKSDLVDPPVDEAGVFYQSIIDGAEVDIDLIQKAIEYAQKDANHYLLPDASQAIKDAVLNKALLV